MTALDTEPSRRAGQLHGAPQRLGGKQNTGHDENDLPEPDDVRGTECIATGQQGEEIDRRDSDQGPDVPTIVSVPDLPEDGHDRHAADDEGNETVLHVRTPLRHAEGQVGAATDHHGHASEPGHHGPADGTAGHIEQYQTDCEGHVVVREQVGLEDQPKAERDRHEGQQRHGLKGTRSKPAAPPTTTARARGRSAPPGRATRQRHRWRASPRTRSHPQRGCPPTPA